MTEEQKEVSVEQAKQAIGENSMKQVEQIAKMIKGYYQALFPNMSSDEYYMIGFNTLIAAWNIISRSNDMAGLDVDTRIATIKATQKIEQQVLDKVYLNPEVVAGQVAQMITHEAANKIKGSKKK